MDTSQGLQLRRDTLHGGCCLVVSVMKLRRACGGVHVSREKRSGVRTCRDGVRGDVGAELGECKCGGNEEHADPIRSTTLDHESLEEVHGVPNGFIVDHH